MRLPLRRRWSIRLRKRCADTGQSMNFIEDDEPICVLRELEFRLGQLCAVRRQLQVEVERPRAKLLPPESARAWSCPPAGNQAGSRQETCSRSSFRNFGWASLAIIPRNHDTLIHNCLDVLCEKAMMKKSKIKMLSQFLNETSPQGTSALSEREFTWGTG